MTEAQALARAIKALKKAYNESNSFDDGDMASWDVRDLIEKALRAEFNRP